MSVVIRLSRTGKRGESIYRIVAVDKKQKRDSMPLEILGTYNKKGALQVQKEQLKAWEKKGAVLSLAVGKLLSEM